MLIVMQGVDPWPFVISPCSNLCFSGSFHPHIFASSCIAPSLLGSSILPLLAS